MEGSLSPFEKIGNFSIDRMIGILDKMKPEHVVLSSGVLESASKIDLIRCSDKCNYYYIFQDELEYVEELFNVYYGEGHIQLAILLTLNPGDCISPHKDVGDSNYHSLRHHFPLSTNDQCENNMGSVKLKMKVGEIWRLDTFNTLHDAKNKGNTPRTHLIVDWVLV